MKRRHAFCALLLGSAITASPAAAAPARAPAPTGPRVALLPLVANGLAADEVQLVDSAIQGVAKAHTGARLIAGRDVERLLDAGGVKGVRCDRTDATCSAQLGAVLNVDQVLVASVTATAEGATIAFRLVDVGLAAQLAHASRKGSAAMGNDEVLAVLKALEEPAARQTSLAFVGAAGSLVVVDGQDRGVLPMPPLVGLPPGRHEVGLDGPVSLKKAVDLRRGEPVVVEAPGGVAPAAGTTEQVTRTAPPPFEPPLMPLLVTVGGGAVTLAGGAVALVGLWPFLAYNTGAAELQRQDALSLQGRDGIDADRVRDLHATTTASAEDWATWGIAATVVGATLAGVGLVAVGAGVWLGLAE